MSTPAQVRALTEQYQSLQDRIQQAAQTQQQLAAQQTENKIVLEELQDLEEDAQVYKLVGTVLVKQSNQDSVDNVQKRLAFIQEELAQVEKVIANNKKDLDRLVDQLKAHAPH